MKLFRRGNRYLVYYSLERGWVYDADVGTCSRERPPADLMGGTAKEWYPVLDDHPIPAGLRDLLILPMDRRGPASA